MVNMKDENVDEVALVCYASYENKSPPSAAPHKSFSSQTSFLQFDIIALSFPSRLETQSSPFILSYDCQAKVRQWPYDSEK